MTIDTLNRFLVTANNGHVIVMRGGPLKLTRDEALNLAAWLVAMADAVGPPFEPTFEDVRKAVESA